MNDWLDYKGSGSIRANANTLEHAASIPNGGKINSIRENAKEAVIQIWDAKYDAINKELDTLYTQMQAQVPKAKKLNAEMNSFINAARRLKAALVISETSFKAMSNKADSIYYKIESFGGSELQKTALKNKLYSISDKYISAVPDLSRLPSEVNVDVFNALIDNINNRSRQNYSR